MESLLASVKGTCSYLGHKPSSCDWKILCICYHNKRHPSIGKWYVLFWQFWLAWQRVKNVLLKMCSNTTIKLAATYCICTAITMYNQRFYCTLHDLHIIFPYTSKKTSYEFDQDRISPYSINTMLSIQYQVDKWWE